MFCRYAHGGGQTTEFADELTFLAFIIVWPEAKWHVNSWLLCKVSGLSIE